MQSSKLVGAGAFVVLGVALFTAALFMIGERRMMFEDRFTVYTEFAKLGQLEMGAVVRVAGMDAGEVTEIQVPRTPAGKFRVRMSVREDLRPLIRTDSIATSQTEGLVGAIYVNIATGSEAAPMAPENGTIPSRDPFSVTDLMQQMSDTVSMVSTTVEALRGDIEKAVQQVALTAEDAHALFEDIRPDMVSIARNGSRITADVQQVLQGVRQGEGTLGKLVTDDSFYRDMRQVADEAKTVVTNVREVTSEARRAISDFRSADGPAQGVLGDMRLTITQAREAVSDLADNMEAMKRNFLLRGFFNRRGYFDLDTISPAEYRKGVLENGNRKAMRIWLGADVLFETGADGLEALSAEGRARIDSAITTYLRYLPSNPLVVEGYATAGTAGERFRLSRTRAGIVREYVLGRYELAAQNTGFIGLSEEAPGNPNGDAFDGVSLTLFLDREALQFAGQKTGAGAR